MALTKIKVQAMNKELETLMATFATKHGLTKGNQRISFSEATCKLTVEFGDKASTGDINPTYFKDCARFGFQHGLDTKQIGSTFKSTKGVMKFCGMRGKFAIVQSPDLKYWKQDPVMVSTLLKTAAALASTNGKF
jgi:hypothetical protein